MTNPTLFVESFKSRKIALSVSGNIELYGSLVNMPDDADDQAVIRSAIDLTAATYSMPSVRLDSYDEPISETYSRNQVTVERLGHGVWSCQITYGRRGRVVITPGVSIGGITIGEEVQRIYSSIETLIAASAFTTDAPDFGKLINVTPDGHCDGCDWGGGAACVRTVRQCFNAASINDTYLATVCRLRNYVNSGSYLGFSAGEVRFLGCDLTQLSTQQWEGQFRFGISPNQSSIVIGDVPSVAKKGWEYLWIYYGTEKATAAGIIVRVPWYVYVEQIYKTSTLSGLALTANSY